jgi:hypothetical protein
MKIRPYCRDCLKDLASRAVTLSGGNEETMASALELVDSLFAPHRNPTEISNRLLKYVRRETGVYDPFEDRKTVEFHRALEASKRLDGFFPETLEGGLRSAAFGNGGDFFMDHPYEPDRFEFSGEVDKIGRQVYDSQKVLILGDNPGDFVFDLPLVRLLKDMGKRVFYAIKEHPVQNDMSIPDAARFKAEGMCPDIVSTGTDEVGIRKEEMSGVVGECWRDRSLVIAKGMGNYETISEFDAERPVVYIMNVKCRSVAETLGRKVGDYIAIAGGDHG